jgi:hypothetical protein
MYHIFLIHSLLFGHLGCFHSLAVVNSAIRNMGVQVSLLYVYLHCFRYLPQSSIAGSYGRFISNFLRILHSAIVAVLIYIH